MVKARKRLVLVLSPLVPGTFEGPSAGRALEPAGTDPVGADSGVR